MMEAARTDHDAVALALPRLRRPSRYLGQERHAVRKDWQAARGRVVLAFPDLYEIGMSHLGLAILYQAVNSQPDLLAERVYAPDLDLEALLRHRGLPLFSLESRRPLADFDLLGVSLPYELSATNILTILDLAGLPRWARDRDDRQPLVVAGGPSAFNPEPVAPFFDAILLGDGEEAIIEMTRLVGEARAAGASRQEILARLAAVEGCYVPAAFAPACGAGGRLQAVRHQGPGPARVRRRILPDLAASPALTRPLVPLARIVHDRLGVEIARGCTRGCRFCQAGIIYRPVRERSPQAILEQARAALAATGFEELALLSLSTGDYACLPGLLTALMREHGPARVSISLPSMRVGTLTPTLMAEIRRVRKTGFTLAPEAGSDRLRQVINKGITEADLVAACQAAFDLGWRQLKLYFMIGLPTETEEDVLAIAQLVRQLSRMGKGRGQVAASVAAFVPKAHTPFQWEPQLSLAESRDRIALIKGAMPARGATLKWHDPAMSLVEGVLARGDRRLAPVIEAVWQDGGRLEAWSEHFSLGRWLAAAERCGVDLADYARERAADEVLPWCHLDPGVETAFLAAERGRARRGEYTPDCRVHGCQGCGVCDFDRLQPVTCPEAAPEPAAVPASRPPAAAGPLWRYRLRYAVQGAASLLGHLELVQAFLRAFRRLRLPLAFSQGFHPAPRVAFSPALSFGVESLAEYLDCDLIEPLAACGQLACALTEELPDGLTVVEVALHPGTSAEPDAACYRIELPRPVPAALLEDFLAQASWPLAVSRKGALRQLDARPLVHAARLATPTSLELVLAAGPGRPTVRPAELLVAALGVTDEELAACRTVKLPLPEPAPQS
ncbi:MAG: TIGR03960 family B12-binding radical SAM protein [Thermodesulfobacteriota bacterium]